MPKSKNDLTAEEVHDMITYDPITGLFFWKYQPNKSNLWNVKYADKKAGYVNNDGYIVITIHRRGYKSHRLAWLYMTGCWPINEIDHINMERDDNRFCNLREATRSENQKNTDQRRSNISGAKGVGFVTSRNKYQARITIHGKRKFIGYFDNLEDAQIAYNESSRKHHGDFSRTTS